MRQALHIFKKDFRYLWREIALFALLCSAFAWGTLGSHEALAITAQVSLTINAIYLIVRVIHAEAVAGDRQFWTTRPYRWTSLLIAKLSFIIVFVNLPFFIARLVVLAGMRFPLEASVPVLLSSHFLLFFATVIPLTVTAALTPGIVPFILLAVIGLALNPLLVELVPPLYSALYSGPNWNASIGWFRDTLALTAVAVLGLSILCAVYRSRRVFPVQVFCGIVILLGAVGYLLLPPSIGIAAQSWLSPQLIPDSAVQVAVTGTPNNWRNGRFSGNRYAGFINFAVVVTGLSGDMEGRLDSFSFRFKDGAGQTRTIAQSWGNAFSASTVFHRQTQIDETSAVLLDRNRDPSETVQASLYLTIFDKVREKTVSVHRVPTNVLDGLQCYVGYLDRLGCRAPLMWPSTLVLIKTKDGAVSLQPIVNAWVTRLNLLPLEERILTHTVSDGEAVTIVIKEPIAYIRKDVDVHMNDIVDVK